jgi:hypothetical protein
MLSIDEHLVDILSAPDVRSASCWRSAAFQDTRPTRSADLTALVSHIVFLVNCRDPQREGAHQLTKVVALPNLRQPAAGSAKLGAYSARSKEFSALRQRQNILHGQQSSIPSVPDCTQCSTVPLQLRVCRQLVTAARFRLDRYCSRMHRIVASGLYLPT